MPRRVKFLWGRNTIHPRQLFLVSGLLTCGRVLCFWARAEFWAQIVAFVTLVQNFHNYQDYNVIKLMTFAFHNHLPKIVSQTHKFDLKTDMLILTTSPPNTLREENFHWILVLAIRLV